MIEGLSGTVATGLHAERVEIDQELVHLRFEDVEARVALAPLLLQTIRSPSVSVGRVLVEVKKRVHPPTPSPPGFLPRWLLINADQVHAGTATLTVYNGFRLVVTELNGAAVLRRHSIRIFGFTGQLEGARVGLSGVLLATDPFGMAVQYHLDWHPAGQPAWTADGSALGDLNALNIVARTASPFRADLSGQLLDLTNHFHWAGDAVLNDFSLEAWGVSGPLGSITGHIAASGDLNTFTGHGPVNPSGLKAGDLRGAVRRRLRRSRAHRAAHAGHAPGVRGPRNRCRHHRHHRQRPAPRSQRALGAVPLAARGPRPAGAQRRRNIHAPRRAAVPRPRDRGGTRRGPGTHAGRCLRRPRQGPLQLRPRRDRPVRWAHQRTWRGGVERHRPLGDRRARHRDQPRAAAPRPAGQPELQLHHHRNAASSRRASSA